MPPPYGILARWAGRCWQRWPRSWGARSLSTPGTRTASAAVRSISNTMGYCSHERLTLAATVAQVAVVALAAWLKRWPVAAYLGLTMPGSRDTAIALACLAA